MKKVYQTNDRGIFIGVTTADLSPLEQEVWLMPAGCVNVEPPKFNEGQLVRWTGKTWVVEDIPPPLPPEPEPELTIEQLAAKAREKRNDLLAASDWTQVIDAPVDQTAWAVYRQALRDITAQDFFPYTINWPVAP